MNSGPLSLLGFTPTRCTQFPLFTAMASFSPCTSACYKTSTLSHIPTPPSGKSVQFLFIVNASTSSHPNLFSYKLIFVSKLHGNFSCLPYHSSWAMWHGNTDLCLFHSILSYLYLCKFEGFFCCLPGLHLPCLLYFITDLKRKQSEIQGEQELPSAVSLP